MRAQTHTDDLQVGLHPVPTGVQGPSDRRRRDLTPPSPTGALTPIDWTEGTWLNQPREVTLEAGEMVVAASPGSDFWRDSADRVSADTGHALLRRFGPGDVVEVSFMLDFCHALDQAGILVRSSERSWIRAGVEVCDGVAQVGAVVTDDESDWSMAPVPAWRGSEVTLRASWLDNNKVSLSAKSSQSGWRRIRVVPWSARECGIGPSCAAPDRKDLRVRFTRWRALTAPRPAPTRLRLVGPHQED